MNSIKKENNIIHIVVDQSFRIFANAIGKIKPSGKNIRMFAIDCVICFCADISQVSVMKLNGIRFKERSEANISLPSNRHAIIHSKKVAELITKMQTTKRKNTICRDSGILFLSKKIDRQK